MYSSISTQVGRQVFEHSFSLLVLINNVITRSYITTYLKSSRNIFATRYVFSYSLRNHNNIVIYVFYGKKVEVMTWINSLFLELRFGNSSRIIDKGSMFLLDLRTMYVL